MRPSECPVVERRVDIPIKCKELELLKSCVEHTAVVVINRLQQDPNDGSHLDQQETWLQSLPVPPQTPPSKSKPDNKEFLYSPKQLRPHSPDPPESHFSNHFQPQSPRQPYSQSPRQSHVQSPRQLFLLSPRQAHSQSSRHMHPPSPRHIHPQSPRQSCSQPPRQPLLQPLEQLHPFSLSQSRSVSPTKSLSDSHPASPRQSQPQSPSQSILHSPKPPLVHSLNQMHLQSPKHSHLQSLNESHPQSPGHSHSQSPNQSHLQSPRHSHLQFVNQSHTYSPTQCHPVSPKHTQLHSPSQSHLQYPRDSHPASPRQAQPHSPRQTHLQSPSHSQSHSPKQSNSPSPRQSHPRTLWYSQSLSSRPSYSHSPKEPHRQLLRQPQFTYHKQPQQLKEKCPRKDLWPDHQKQPQLPLQKQVVVNLEKLPEESPKCGLQELQHSPPLKQQQNSLHKELYVQLEKLADESQDEVTHHESPKVSQFALHKQLHVQLEKLTEGPHKQELKQQQLSPVKKQDNPLLNQLQVSLEKLPEDSLPLAVLHQHQHSSSLNHPQLLKPKQLHVQLEKLPVDGQNCEVKQQVSPFSNGIQSTSHNRLVTQVEEKAQPLPVQQSSRYTIPIPEPVVTRQRIYLQQQQDTQQKWCSPAFQPRVVLHRLTPEHLARTLQARVVLHRLSSKDLKKHGIQEPPARKPEQVLQKPAIDIDDEDWFDLNRQEWTLCSILQAREKSVFAVWRAANMPRKPRKKHFGVNGFVRKPARINKITFMSKLGLKRRHL